MSCLINPVFYFYTSYTSLHKLRCDFKNIQTPTEQLSGHQRRATMMSVPENYIKQLARTAAAEM
jgi:hypothetical protein